VTCTKWELSIVEEILNQNNLNNLEIIAQQSVEMSRPTRMTTIEAICGLKAYQRYLMGIIGVKNISNIVVQFTHPQDIINYMET